MTKDYKSENNIFGQKNQTMKTYEIVIVDPNTKKCRKIRPSSGGLFIVRIEGIYKNGESKSIEELSITMGEELEGCPI